MEIKYMCIHTRTLKQQFCYTLIYMWVGWTLTCFDCGAGGDNILWKFVSLYSRSTELVDLIKILGLFWSISSSVDKWRSRSKQNKAYASSNGFILFNLGLDDQKGLEGLCFTYPRKVIFQQPGQIYFRPKNTFKSKYSK